MERMGRYCVCCGYCLRGHKLGDVCPECGTFIARMADRRQPWWVLPQRIVITLVVIVGATTPLRVLYLSGGSAHFALVGVRDGYSMDPVFRHIWNSLSALEAVGCIAGMGVGVGLYCVSCTCLRMALVASVLAICTTVGGVVGRYVLLNSRMEVDDPLLAMVVCGVYICARLRLSFLAATMSTQEHLS